MGKGIRYFNFPIYLLRGFLTDSREVLDRIFDYCLFAHTLRDEEYFESDDEAAIILKMKAAMKYYNVKLGDPIASYRRGLELYTSHTKRYPHCGFNVSIFWDYYDNKKSDFDKACLLMFLAIKSILGPKPYCKITNQFILSRMDGRPKQSNNISPELQRFGKEYQFGKLKNELELNWYLRTYGRAVRGFYVSFEMTLDELAYVAELNREKYRISKLRQEKKSAAQKARERIKNELKISRPI